MVGFRSLNDRIRIGFFLWFSFDYFCVGCSFGFYGVVRWVLIVLGLLLILVLNLVGDREFF